MSDAKLFTEIQGDWAQFRWDVTQWHTPSVIAAAWASDISYPREGRSEDETDAEVAKQFGVLGFDTEAIHLDGGVDAFIVARDYAEGPRVAVIVRGSQMNRDDWLTNGRISRAEINFLPLGGRGHHGFTHAGIEVGQAGMKVLSGWDIKLKDALQIRYLGHSQGGAIAQVVGEYWLHAMGLSHGRNMCYSFSSPRVWHADADPELRHLRIFHERDFVPLGPPLALGYRHRGEAHLIRDDATRVGKISGKEIAMQRLKTLARLAMTGAAFAPVRILLVMRALWKGAKSHSIGDRLLPLLRRLPE